MTVSWCVLFFFKQKTAYEVRISDGSADVCSSDLLVQCCLAVAQAGDQLVGPGLGCRAGVLLGQLSTNRPCHAFQRQLLRLAVLLGTQHHDGFRAIVRASCRESVWQYV